MIIAVIKPESIWHVEMKPLYEKGLVVTLAKCSAKLYLDNALIENGSIVAWMDEPQHTCDMCKVEYVTQ